MNEPTKSGKKSGLTIFAGGRHRKLYRLKPGGTYYVRFQVRGKDIERSTGVTIESAAKPRAKEIVEAEINGDQDKAREMKMRSDACTLRTICDRYLEKFGSSDTARKNVSCLAKIVREGAGLSLENARTTVLSAKLIRDFEAADSKRIEQERNGAFNRESMRRVRTSIESVVRQARSIFTRKYMHWYDGMGLSAAGLVEFRQQGVLAPKRARHAKPLNEEAIAAVVEDSKRLALEDPSVYVAFILFAFLGMRNCEIVAARRNWIRRNADGSATLDIMERPDEDFSAKSYERHLPVDPEILRILDEHYKQSTDGDFLVPAAHKTEREEIVYDRHRLWVRQWIKDYTKNSYELRRYAGSLLLDKTGGNLVAVRDFLGHASISTTEKWYAYRIRPLPGLSFKDIMPNGHSVS
jgi:integrase